MIVGRVETALGLHGKREIPIPIVLGRDRGARHANHQCKGARLDDAEPFAINADFGRKAANGDTRSAAIIVSLVKAGLSRELDVESNPFNGKGEPHSSSPRPSSPLFANVDRSLLSDEERSSCRAWHRSSTSEAISLRSA